MKSRINLGACEALLERDQLGKETHDAVARRAPLIKSQAEIDAAVQQFREVVTATDRPRMAS